MNSDFKAHVLSNSDVILPEGLAACQFLLLDLDCEDRILLLMSSGMSKVLFHRDYLGNFLVAFVL